VDIAIVVHQTGNHSCVEVLLRRHDHGLATTVPGYRIDIGPPQDVSRSCGVVARPRGGGPEFGD
jgi:hypothetical protein